MAHQHPRPEPDVHERRPLRHGVRRADEAGSVQSAARRLQSVRGRNGADVVTGDRVGRDSHGSTR